MKRPAFQFYPGDWKTNANLRRCSWAARGVWIEVMGLMHDSDAYGVLRWPLKEIAQALGCPLPMLRELVDKGVMRGADKGEVEALSFAPRSGRSEGAAVELLPACDGPVWFSARMVKDEYLRGVRGAGGRFGGGESGGSDGGEGLRQAQPERAEKRPKAASDPSPKGGLGEGSSDGPSTSSSSSNSSSIPSKIPLEPLGAGEPVDPFVLVCRVVGLVPTARGEAKERAIFEAWAKGWPGFDLDRDVLRPISAALLTRKGPTSSLARFERVVMDGKARAVAKGAGPTFDHSAEGPAERDFRRAAEKHFSDAQRQCCLDPCRFEAGESMMRIVAPSAFAADFLMSNFGVQLAGVAKRAGVRFQVVAEGDRG